MIQRKQTIFLLLALLAIVVCLCLPIGEMEPKGMGMPVVWYNLGFYRDQAFQARPLPFADLVVTGVLTFVSIFLYKKRRLQAKMCTAGMVLCLAWLAYYSFVVFNEFQTNGTFHFQFAACLPFVAFVLLFMARQGVVADEKLVRSMDRIR
ncbi:MAG: DUF4293 domain-containing protein [Prevotella sp.]|nr:DUF4293 domain-containing protein [Prevotella sp.]